MKTVMLTYLDYSVVWAMNGVYIEVFQALSQKMTVIRSFVLKLLTKKEARQH